MQLQLVATGHWFQGWYRISQYVKCKMPWPSTTNRPSLGSSQQPSVRWYKALPTPPPLPPNQCFVTLSAARSRIDNLAEQTVFEKSGELDINQSNNGNNSFFEPLRATSKSSSSSDHTNNKGDKQDI